MKVILIKDVSNLGEEGDIKVVANGYARNYLIPQKMALPYNPGRRRRENRRRHRGQSQSIAR